MAEHPLAICFRDRRRVGPPHIAYRKPLSEITAPSAARIISSAIQMRLLKASRRQVPNLPAYLGLVDSLEALRQGRFLQSGQKLLLVLDQFEQWLHARSLAPTPLTLGDRG
ncbi:MAG TPA: hypothetical protein VH592_07165 [Gemmataceae bacterium]